LNSNFKVKAHNVSICFPAVPSPNLTTNGYQPVTQPAVNFHQPQQQPQQVFFNNTNIHVMQQPGGYQMVPNQQQQAVHQQPPNQIVHQQQAMPQQQQIMQQQVNTNTYQVIQQQPQQMVHQQPMQILHQALSYNTPAIDNRSMIHQVRFFFFFGWQRTTVVFAFCALLFNGAS
jgi:hypothetical protein